MHELIFQRKGQDFVTVKFSDNATQRKEVMGVNEVTLQFTDSRHIPFQIGDSCEVFGEVYSLHALPSVTKLSSLEWSYSLTLQGQGADLSKVLYLFLGDDNSLKEPEFSLMGTALDFVNLILTNLQRAGFTDWTIGEVVTTDYKNLTFAKDNCYNALSKIAEAFETEFWLEGTKILLTKVQRETGRVYKQGLNNGLYKIDRLNHDSGNICTRLFVYGSEKNLPPTYRNFSKRLRLAGEPDPCLISNVTCEVVHSAANSRYTFSFTPPTSTDVTALSIEYRRAGSAEDWSSNTGAKVGPRTMEIPRGAYEFRFRSQGGSCATLVTDAVIISATTTIPMLLGGIESYIEANVDKYGLIEYVQTFDDIYPHRTGVVSAVDATNPFKVIDTSIDFDINSYLLPGVTAKITFNTGQLAGYTFDLSSYNHSTKTITFLQNKDEKHLDVPSELLRPAIGDQYVLVDIYLPQSYIDAAESALESKARTFLAQASEPQVKYQIDLDPKKTRVSGYVPKIGDLIWLEDNDFNIKLKLRVVSTTRSLTQEYSVQVDVANAVSYGKFEQLISASQSNSQNIDSLNKQVENSKENKLFLPTYNSDAEAGTAGLTKGMLYQLPTGVVCVKL